MTIETFKPTHTAISSPYHNFKNGEEIMQVSATKELDIWLIEAYGFKAAVYENKTGFNQLLEDHEVLPF